MYFLKDIGKTVNIKLSFQYILGQLVVKRTT